MINVILGGVGSGKTTFLTWSLFCRALCETPPYTIFSNYTLYDIDYVPLNSINDFGAIRGERIAIGGDEIWLTIDARASGKNRQMTKYLLQQRKFATGRKYEFYGSSQTWAQIDLRLRQITHIVYEPEILLADPDGKPSILKVDRWDCQRGKYLTPIIAPMVMDFGNGRIIDICDQFETGEVLDALHENQVQTNEKLIAKYAGRSDMDVGEVATALEYDPDTPVNHSRATVLAKYIKLRDSGKIK